MARKLYLSWIKNGSEGVSGVQSNSDILYEMIESSGLQKRNGMKRHSLLDLAAQKKLDDMFQNNYYAHKSPSGVHANENVLSVGYKLPYPKKANMVESLCIGGNKPLDTFNGWVKSSGHADHVFGRTDFFKEQECIGMADGKARDGRFLYVFLSAPCYE